MHAGLQASINVRGTPFLLDCANLHPAHIGSNCRRTPPSYSQPCQLQRIQRRCSHRCHSGNERALSLAKDFAATKLFRYWVQGAVFLIVLAAVDAAYSGDWSRVGVISKETENSLKPLVVGLGLFHAGCAVVTARIAKEKELNVIPRVLKVLAVGFLALVETYLADGEED